MSGLVADYGSSSESDSEQQTDQERHIEEVPTVNSITPPPTQKPKKKKEKLANPLRGKKTQNLFSETASVFYNPFHKDQEAKKLVLEKHVKMTLNPKDVIEINGKKICWNYRKGRCKFGHTCKYAHDSDLIGSDYKPGDSSTKSPHDNNYPMLANSVQISGEDALEEETKKRKIRAGLSEGLKPNKKAKKLFKQLQQKERPWINDG